MLPCELWEMILQFIDNPIELLRLQCVCKDWKTLIIRILRKTQKWRELCRKIIPNDCELRKALEKASPALMYHSNCPVLEDDNIDPHTWERVYRLINKWQMCPEVAPSIDTTTITELRLGLFGLEDNTKFQQIALWDDIIAIGLDNGQIFFSKIYDLSNPFFSIHDYNDVLQIVFWYTNKRLIAVIRPYDESSELKFWDVMKKVQLNNEGHTTSSLLYSNQNQCYSTCGCDITLFVLQADTVKSNTVSIPIESDDGVWNCSYDLQADEFHVQVVISHWPTDNDWQTMFAYNTIVEPDGNRTLVIVENKEQNVIGQPIKSSFDHTYCPYIFSRDIMIATSGLNAVSVSYKCGEWVTHENSMNLNGEHPYGFYFYANILIAIPDSPGTIDIFRVNKIEDILYPDFTTLVPKTIRVDNDPIIFTEICCFGGKPTIIVGTDSNIHILKFP